MYLGLVSFSVPGLAVQHRLSAAGAADFDVAAGLISAVSSAAFVVAVVAVAAFEVGSVAVAFFSVAVAFAFVAVVAAFVAVVAAFVAVVAAFVAFVAVACQLLLLHHAQTLPNRPGNTTLVSMDQARDHRFDHSQGFRTRPSASLLVRGFEAISLTTSPDRIREDAEGQGVREEL
jgi:hypothetical protein